MNKITNRNNEKIIKDNFTEIKLSLNNLWVYQIRKNVYNSLVENNGHFYGKILDIGCGIMPYKSTILSNTKVTQYIGLDLEHSSYYADIKPDLLWDGKTIPLVDNSIDCVIATEVLEHCYSPELLLKEVFRVLKPGGLLFCTVPFIWHLHEVPYDEYRYTPFSLEKKLIESGYTGVIIKPLGGWDSALGQLLGLWVTYRPMGRLRKSLLLRVIKMIIKKLERSDKIPSSFDNASNSMISGLSALCKKPG